MVVVREQRLKNVQGMSSGVSAELAGNNVISSEKQRYSSTSRKTGAKQPKVAHNGISTVTHLIRHHQLPLQRTG